MESSTHILWCRGVVVGRVVAVRFVLWEGSPRVTDLAQISEHVPFGQDSMVTGPLDDVGVLDVVQDQEAQDRGEERFVVLRVGGGMDGGGSRGGGGGGRGRRVGRGGGSARRSSSRSGGRFFGGGDLDAREVVALFGEDGDQLADGDTRCTVTDLPRGRQGVFLAPLFKDHRFLHGSRNCLPGEGEGDSD